MYDKLPSELKENALFCLWKYEERNGKIQKVPYQVNGTRANHTNRKTFSDYQSVVTNLSGYDGIAVGTFDSICNIDIDDCVFGGKLTELAQHIVAAVDSYAEFSPSGTGIHITCYVKGIQYDKKRYYINNQKIGLEVYVAPFVTHTMAVTGNALNNKGIEERTEAVKEILEKHMVKPEKPQKAKSKVPGSYLSDESVITKALASKQSEKFKALWNGEIPDGKSHSEADQALCAMLVPRGGVEPPRVLPRWILSPLRLPFRHSGTLSASKYY